MRSLPLAAVVLALCPATAFAGHHHRNHGRWHDHDTADQLVAAPPVDQGTFGAIAYSPSTGKIGWAYGFGDGESAKAAATSSCGVGDCAWQVMEQNEYAVLATGTGGAAVAWNTDYATAEADALAACNAKGTGCAVNQWVFK